MNHNQWYLCLGSLMFSLGICFQTAESESQNVNAHILSRGYAQTPFTQRSDEFNADSKTQAAESDKVKLDNSKKVNMYSHQLYNSKRNKRNRTLVGGDQAVDRHAVPLQDRFPTVVGQVD